MKDKPLILVVDDQPQNIELIEAYLVPQGYEIVKAASGEKALEILSGDHIDLILLDVMMPGMDGFEVTRRVRQDDKHRLLPIILVTALRETEDRVKGIEAGCDDFLSKPFDKVELLARVKSLLQVKAYNDLMNNYRKELESEVARRTKEKDELVRKLQNSEALLKATGKMVKVGGWEVDAETLEVNWTEEIYHIYELPPGHKPPLEEAINYFHSDERQKLSNSIQRSLNAGEAWDMEMRFISEKGNHLWIRAICSPQMLEGKTVRLIGTLQDITVRKQTEEVIHRLNAELEQRVLERTSQLEAANKELESFAYSVSHDLRAPLRGIDGWSLALLEDYKDKLDEQGRQYIDLVRSETQIMGRLIDDLLMFSRQSRAEMNQQQLDMTAMAQSIVARLQQQNPTLQADFIIQPGLRALGDAGMIEIALKNLLDNAAKFSSKLSRAVIEFGQVEQEGRKTFFVRDNGVGFDMAYANKLFGVFQRLHKTSEFPGTGIGLASVQRIINRHGGRIWAEAKVNEGATFYFTLKEAT